ncbi:hypothetical protein [Methylobacterium indicum]|uniref:Uncharacterized protein n=1 Tax=Methylobacterium indicum TaxID=1775910 RepID=A0A8H8WYJ4_9HYPH|nr:hypothetical protein [Methylobacterium indicum]BCM86804.1 hypothetical protein mvi_52650 [Methylobacterium indicum]
MTTAVTSASVTGHPALTLLKNEARPLPASRAAAPVEDISRYRTIDSPLALGIAAAASVVVTVLMRIVL